QRPPALSRDEGGRGRAAVVERQGVRRRHREPLLQVHLRRRQRRALHVHVPPRRPGGELLHAPRDPLAGDEGGVTLRRFALALILAAVALPAAAASPLFDVDRKYVAAIEEGDVAAAKKLVSSGKREELDAM